MNLNSTSRSMSKGVHGIGAVVVESLRGVWGGSKVRINNRLDTSVHPFSSQTGAVFLIGMILVNVMNDDLSCGEGAGRGSRREQPLLHRL